MNLSDKDRKLLWGKAKNVCSYRFKGTVCSQPLVLTHEGNDVVVGNECHIIGEKPGSARYLADFAGRETYENAILLCPVHHKLIDDTEGVHTSEVLRRMKSEHEQLASFDKDRPLKFEASEFVTEVSNADRVVGMEVNRPASFTGVRSTLKATNVREAIGFSTNQGLTASISWCSHCAKPVPSAHTGSPPFTIRCPHCGHEIRIG
jgi:hypothetical protein